MTIVAEGTPADHPLKQAPMIWVKPSTPVKVIANLITSSIVEEQKISLRAIGAGAVNQAFKGTVAARQQMASQGFDLLVRPGMMTVTGTDGSEVTAAVFHCLLL